MVKGTEVFATLADDYARYRPGYPGQVVDELVRVSGLTRDWIIADIGSGSGNSALPFLEAGYQVIGVEPNREMREAAERLLAAYPAFHSIDSAAERIPLDAHSVDLIIIGQAWHWFDIDSAIAEFQRILRPDGWVAVMWNNRLGDATEFTRAYAELTQHCATVQPPSCAAPRGFGDDLDRLFGNATPQEARFPHTQSFDLKGLLGRARSSGFIPQPGAPNHDEFTALMTDLFDRYQCDGAVEFHYITQLYIGHLDEK